MELLEKGKLLPLLLLIGISAANEKLNSTVTTQTIFHDVDQIIKDENRQSVERNHSVVGVVKEDVSTKESVPAEDSHETLRSGQPPRVALGFGNVLDLTNRIPLADSRNGDQLSTVKCDGQEPVSGSVEGICDETSENHQPLQCDGLKPQASSIEGICVNSQLAWSCKDKCSYSIKAPCSCDINCLVHNTCCLDFEVQCPELAHSSREELAAFPGLYSVCDHSFLTPLISHCPESASEEEHGLCGQNRENLSSVLDLAPVSDSFYLWSFRNKHCWRCWHTGHKALRWQVNVTMSMWSRMSEDYRLESLISFMASNRDKVQWFPPRGIVKGQCTNNVVSHCSACGVTNDTVDSCVHGPHAYVQTPSGVYKNLHCYLCSKHHKVGQKVTCLAKELGTITMHNMNFPVTMILPDDDDVSEVKLVQEERAPGDYTWDKLTCSLTRGTCQVRQCGGQTFLVNGECNSDVRALTLRMRFCESETVDGDPECSPLDRTVHALSPWQQQQILQRVVEFADLKVRALVSPNVTFLDSAVSVAQSGLHVQVMWVVPFYDEPLTLLIRTFLYDMVQLIPYNIVGGTILFCSSWASQNQNEKPTDIVYDFSSCNTAFMCHPDISSDLRTLTSPNTAGIPDTTNPLTVAFFGFSMVISCFMY